MIEPEQFFWRGWDCDSFFDDDVQAVLMRLHPHRVVCKGVPSGDVRAKGDERAATVCWCPDSQTIYARTPDAGWQSLKPDDEAFQSIWGYPVAAWKAIDQFRIANRSDTFEMFDFELLQLLKLSPMWFFELGHAVFKWKNERAKRFNEANRNRKNADVKTALEYWYTQRPVHGAAKVSDGKIRFEDFPPPEMWDAVVWEIKQLGFGDYKNERLRKSVEREDTRRRKIVDLWAQGFASALNYRVKANAVAGEAYRAYYAGPRDRKR